MRFLFGLLLIHFCSAALSMLEPSSNDEADIVTDINQEQKLNELKSSPQETTRIMAYLLAAFIPDNNAKQKVAYINDVHRKSLGYAINKLNEEININKDIYHKLDKMDRNGLLSRNANTLRAPKECEKLSSSFNHLLFNNPQALHFWRTKGSQFLPPSINFMTNPTYSPYRLLICGQPRGHLATVGDDPMLKKEDIRVRDVIYAALTFQDIFNEHDVLNFEHAFHGLTDQTHELSTFNPFRSSSNPPRKKKSTYPTFFTGGSKFQKINGDEAYKRAVAQSIESFNNDAINRASKTHAKALYDLFDDDSVTNASEKQNPNSDITDEDINKILHNPHLTEDEKTQLIAAMTQPHNAVFHESASNESSKTSSTSNTLPPSERQDEAACRSNEPLDKADSFEDLSDREPDESTLREIRVKYFTTPGTSVDTET